MTIDRLPDDDESLAALLRRSRALEDAPEALIQRAILLWQAPALAPAAAQGPLRRWVASLRFDSATASPLAHGLRAAGDGSRQILYFSEGRDIDIRVIPLTEPAGRRWRVAGQVLGPDTVGSTELRSGGRTDVLAWNELSEFSFSGVEPGPCVLLLRGSDWELELPPLDLPQ